MTSKMFVVKNSIDAKASSIHSDPRDPTGALDAYFLISLPRRRDQYFNPNFRSN
jgi:hypothetical protein